MMKPLLTACLIVLTGCTDFPDVDSRLATSTDGAAFPTLVPIDTILYGGDSPRLGEDDAETLLNRVANLRAKARRLQTTVLTGAERTQLLEAVKRLGT